MTKRWRLSFLVSMLVTTAICLSLAWKNSSDAQWPHKPLFPVPGKAYVASYSAASSAAAHYLFYYGLFGFGDRIRDSDVLFFGSSHMQFDLSAAELSKLMSEAAGRRVKVLNLGLGCTETPEFDAKILDRNHVNGKTVVVDLFAEGWPKSHCASEVEQADTLGAYFQVSQIWMKFSYDWALDGWLPRVFVLPGSIKLGRFLGRSIVISDWQTGDTLDMWIPESGTAFPETDDKHTTALDDKGAEPPWNLAPGEMPAPTDLNAVVSRGNLNAVFTLLLYRASREFLANV